MGMGSKGAAEAGEDEPRLTPPRSHTWFYWAAVISTSHIDGYLMA